MDLKLCPRCHAKPELFQEKDPGESGYLIYCVQCECGAHSPEFLSDEGDAIDAWNSGDILPTLPIDLTDVVEKI